MTRPAGWRFRVGAGEQEQNTQMWKRSAKFGIGEVVQHRHYPFRGVVYEIDPAFDNSDEWWHSIPEEIRPRKDQPYYHLLAENDRTTYVAYVSEQNLRPDDTGRPCRHPQIKSHFENFESGRYIPRPRAQN